MKKIIVYACLSLVTSVALGHSIVVNNETNYPIEGKLGKIAVEWAASNIEIQNANKAIMQGKSLAPSSLKQLTQIGKNRLSLPDTARYFRIVAWSSNQREPDLLTNWVEVMPNKIYTIKQDELSEAALIFGSGC